MLLKYSVPWSCDVRVTCMDSGGCTLCSLPGLRIVNRFRRKFTGCGDATRRRRRLMVCGEHTNTRALHAWLPRDHPSSLRSRRTTILPIRLRCSLRASPSMCSVSASAIHTPDPRPGPGSADAHPSNTGDCARCCDMSKAQKVPRAPHCYSWLISTNRLVLLSCFFEFMVLEIALNRNVTVPDGARRQPAS